MGRGDSVLEFGAPPDRTIDQLITAEPSVPTTESASLEGYSYTRVDGTVEHAATRQEAVKLCPVLGELALKDPQAAELLLEVAALGEAEVQEDRSAKAGFAPVESKVIKPAKEAAGKVAAVEDTKAEPPAPSNKRSPQLETVETLKPGNAGINGSPAPASAYSSRKSAVLSLEQLQNISRVENNIDDEGVSAATKPQRPPAEAERLRDGRPTVFLADQLQNRVYLKSVAASELPAGPDQEGTAYFQVVKNDEPDKFTEVPEKPVGPAKVGESDEILDPQGTQPTRAAEAVADSTQYGQIEASDREWAESYRKFAENLRVLANAAPEAQPAQDTNEIQDASSEFERTPPAEPAPEIVSVVSERLDALEPEQLTAMMPIVQELAAATREAAVSIQKNNSDSAEAVESKCEILVGQLFDELGLEYRAEDVRRFVSVIVSPDFSLSAESDAEEITRADLEHDGTHEAKTRSSASANFLDAIGRDVRSMLGAFVVLRTFLQQAS